MNNFGFLLLFGILTLAQAKPQGYSYTSPAILPKPEGPAFLPQLNQLAGQAPQQLYLNQVQQSSSYQQNLPISQSSPQLNQPQGISNRPIQQGYSYQQPQPQLNVVPQIPLPQGNINNFQSSLQQSLPQIPLQTQVSFNQQLQTNPIQQNLPQFNPQPSFQNQPSQNFVNDQNLVAIESSQNSQQRLIPDISNQNNQQQENLVTKHIYVHVPPEDHSELSEVQALSQPLPVRKNYKIIFIKAPTTTLTQARIVAQQQAQQVEEKTLVYVLVNKPHESDLVLPTAAPTHASKPEVYFIKYKSNSKVNGPSLGGGNLAGSSSGPIGSGLPIIKDIASGQNQVPINSGESTSSLFSGGLPGPGAPSTKYGPPGYQKRSVQ